MMRVIAAFFLSLSLLACGRQSRAIKLDAVPYYFPADHISYFIDPDDTASKRFAIGLRPPGGYYRLVYDPWLTDKPNKQGIGVPTIAYINDVPREVNVIQTDVGPLVCLKTPVNEQSPYLREIFSCGLRVYDKGVLWSVLIPGDLAASAPALKRRAELTLAAYRRDPRAAEAK